MKSLIVISFAFLGWSFYELSDGADFEPPQPPAKAVAKADTKARTSPGQPETIIANAKPVQVVAEPAHVPAQAAVLKSEPQLPKSEIFNSPFASAAPAGDGSDAGASLKSLEDGGAQFASLLDGLNTKTFDAMPSADTAAAASDEPPLVTVDENGVMVLPVDLREITGTRVNMRDGPGTTFQVVTRLTIGREVEVLGDSGTGWLRLRTLPDRQTGWVAASLVSKSGT